MQAIYTGNPYINPGGQAECPRTVTLPIDMVSSRAIIVRRSDGALLGTLHRENGRIALPGGLIDDGENPEDTILRELDEENITLQGSDDDWRSRLSVDYFSGYRALSLWYIFVVANAEVTKNDETIETKWFQQEEDVWYPNMREKIILAMQEHVPDLVKIQINFLTTM
ncbi:MAG: NUDIX hydrolase [Anaerolineae bacterium]|nr:NUDIX hydrolase [Anaerolineae bacterium]